MKKAFLQLHAAVFLAGFTAILGKLIVLNEGLLVWYRLFFSIILIGGLLILKKEFTKISLQEFIKISGVGLLLAFHWVAFYASVKYANASVAVVCLSASGFFSTLLEPIVLRKRIVMTEMLLGLLSILGIYIIFDFHPQYKTGIIFGMLSSFGSALFPMFNKELLKQHSPIILTFYEFLGGLICLSCLLPFYFTNFIPSYYLPSFNDVVWLLVLTIFCTMMAFDFQLKALQKISAFTTNLTYNLEPLYGILLAFIIFRENQLLNNHFYLGLFFILLAIMLQMIRVFRQSKIKDIQ
jgi:drug/metabolite transporter (DMT)-like permease